MKLLMLISPVNFKLDRNFEDVSTWGFPKSWGYPQSSSISRWDFPLSTIHFGNTSMTMETSKSLGMERNLRCYQTWELLELPSALVGWFSHKKNPSPVFFSHLFLRSSFLFPWLTNVFPWLTNVSSDPFCSMAYDQTQAAKWDLRTGGFSWTMTTRQSRQTLGTMTMWRVVGDFGDFLSVFQPAHESICSPDAFMPRRTWKDTPPWEHFDWTTCQCQCGGFLRS